MAGGQERVLRRRIKSVQSTKKITKAMELIAATRIVKAQERADAARPYSERDHRGDPQPGCRPAPAKEHPLLRDNPDARTAGLRGHHRRPWPVRRLQQQRHPLRRARDRPRPRPRAATLADRRRQEGPELLPLPGLPRSTPPSPASPTSPPTRTPATSPPPCAAASRRASYAYGRAGLHPVPLRRRAAGGGQAVPAARGPTARRAADRPVGRLRVRAVARRASSNELLPRYARGPALRRPARRLGVGARRPAAGHEGRHRQRRRPHHHAHPGA